MGVPAHTNHDAAIYPQTAKYDGYRSYKKHQAPGSEQRFQFMTNSPESFRFGHGVHACPGRFFAANETKILLIHLLLKYDWKLADGADEPKWRAKGNILDCDRLAKVAFRRRENGQEMAL